MTWRVGVAVAVVLACITGAALFAVDLAVIRAVRCKFVLSPGFHGSVPLAEDPNLPLDYSRVYTFQVRDGVMLVPKGFLSQFPHSPRIETEEIRDTNGKLMEFMGDGNYEPMLASYSDETHRQRFYFSFGPMMSPPDDPKPKTDRGGRLPVGKS